MSDNTDSDAARQAFNSKTRTIVEACVANPGVALLPPAIEHARSMSSADRMNFRKRLIEVGVSPIGKWDAAVDAGAKEDESSPAGRLLDWEDDTPTEHPISASDLLSDASDFFLQHVDMPLEFADTCALWLAHANLHHKPELRISTFLNLTSATKGCGKSLLMDCLASVAPRPLQLGASITEAALFRIIEQACPTIFADEVDMYMKDNPQLIGALNASQRYGQGAIRTDTSGQTPEVRIYSTWSPKVFAGIGDIPDTTRDRSIIFIMERADASRALVPWDNHDAARVARLRAGFARWRDDYDAAALAARPYDISAYPPGFNHRGRDAWRSLFGIATHAGPEWLKRAQSAAAFITNKAGVSLSPAEELLHDIRTVFDNPDRLEPRDCTFSDGGKVESITSQALVKALGNMTGHLWERWSRGDKITETGLSGKRLLGAFTPPVRARRKRADGGRRMRYYRADFARLWGRYGAEPCHPAQSKAGPSVESSANPGQANNAGQGLDGTQHHGNSSNGQGGRVERGLRPDTDDLGADIDRLFSETPISKEASGGLSESRGPVGNGHDVEAQHVTNTMPMQHDTLDDRVAKAKELARQWIKEGAKPYDAKARAAAKYDLAQEAMYR